MNLGEWIIARKHALIKYYSCTPVKGFIPTAVYLAQSDTDDIA